jgi:pyridoxamine 5'-phosphate oxidase
MRLERIILAGGKKRKEFRCAKNGQVNVEHFVDRSFTTNICGMDQAVASVNFNGDEDRMDEIEVETALDPIALFRAWMKDAVAREVNDPDAMALATATPDGVPSVRMLLMKRVDDRGFCFYTNAESQKGSELARNPHAAMCFHWKSLRRQVRISGTVEELSGEDADAYFNSRSRLSQFGAVASQQSRILTSREMLVDRVKELEREFPGEIPRPDYWRGYVLRPVRIEFWKDGEGRLHDRFIFSKNEGSWRKERLFP